jgi:hypothetical protein
MSNAFARSECKKGRVIRNGRERERERERGGREREGGERGGGTEGEKRKHL